MKQINLNSRGRKVGVRRDKRRARPAMTKAGGLDFNPSLHQHNDDRTGDWKKWWKDGCGVDSNGKPYCPPGHAYYIERLRRGLHRGSKIYGRRQERRRNNKIEMDE